MPADTPSPDTSAPGRPMLHDPQSNPEAFPRLSEEQMNRLETLATCQEFEDGQYLFKAGDREIGFFIVREGKVRIVRQEDGKETVITVHGPGGFTGELQMVNKQPSVVSAIAEGPTKVLRLDPGALEKVLAEESEIGEVILRALLERRELLEESELTGVQLIGSRWSARTLELKDFLARSDVLFRWRDPDADAETEALLRHFRVKPAEMPVVICDTGGLMRRPTRERLADCLGLRPEVEHELYDVAVVGAGPAGLAAAVYAASEGLRTVVLDAVAPGGQAGASSKIENYLGFPTGISGEELADRAATQARKFRATISCPSRAIALDCGPTKTLTLDNDEQVRASIVILATGAKYRRLEAENREKFEQKGIYYGATYTEAPTCSGEEVIVVGGGNSAGQAAVFLAGFAKKVYLLIRGDSLALSMSRYLIDRIEGSDDIELWTGCQITAFHGEQRLQEVTVACGDGGEKRIKAAGVFVMIGADPNTDWLKGCIGLDERGFVVTGSDARRHGEFAEHWKESGREPFLLETTRPGVFAVGDIRSGSIKRVASAVGEGAMAVKFVHEVLAM